MLIQNNLYKKDYLGTYFLLNYLLIHLIILLNYITYLAKKSFVIETDIQVQTGIL